MKKVYGYTPKEIVGRVIIGICLVVVYVGINQLLSYMGVLDLPLANAVFDTH